MRMVIMAIALVMYFSGIIATGIATDVKIGCPSPACEGYWQIPAAFFWPAWVPVYGIYKLVSS